MKSRDLFLPKLAYSDPNVRKKAVLKEKVIENDKNPDVRRAANRRLKDLSA